MTINKSGKQIALEHLNAGFVFYNGNLKVYCRWSNN